MQKPLTREMVVTEAFIQKSRALFKCLRWIG